MSASCLRDTTVGCTLTWELRSLASKNLADPTVIKGALSVLAQELIPATSGYTLTPKYRTNLMTSFLYKYHVDACVTMGAQVPSTEQSAAPSWYPRPVSSGVQSFDASSTTGAPVPKLCSHRQVRI